MRGPRLVLQVLVVMIVATVLPLTAAGTAHAAKAKTISIKDASIVEGDAGPSKSLAFTVNWTGSKGGGSVSVAYATTAVTATAGSDYTTKTGTVGLSNGSCHCGTISVPIPGDNLAESTETFQVNLSSPVNATIADGQAIGTIYDNEGPTALIVTDAGADEAAGTMSFSVQLTSGSIGSVTLDYATAEGSALAGSDYTSTSGSLTFTSGQTLKSVAVPVTGDALNEDDETFTLNASNVVGAAVTASQGSGTIADDDAEPDLSVEDASVTEGDAGDATASFAVGLSAASGREVTVDYATSDGTGLSGSDYEARSGTLTFAAGETSKTVDVLVAGDLVHETDETFAVSLSSPSNSNTLDANAVGTITDDDPVPLASVGDVTMVEGNAGTTTATFSVWIANPSAFTASVEWTTADVSAVAGADYETAGGTVTFLPGEESHTVDVTVDGDTIDEVNETFDVMLANATNAVVGDGTGSCTITDDDRTPTALTLTAKKTTRTIKAAGLLESAASGMKVKVTLLKRIGRKYVKVLTKTATVTGLGDRDGDGKADAAFVAAFKRPARGRYKLIAKYGGDAEYLASVRKLTFKV